MAKSLVPWCTTGLLGLVALSLLGGGWFTVPGRLVAVPSSGPGAGEARGGGTALRVLAAFDVSQSMTVAEKRQAVGLFKALFERTLPARTRVTMLTFARQARKCYDGTPLTWGDLWPALDSAVIRSPDLPQGTSQVGVLDAVRNELPAEPGVPAAVLLFTDGENLEPGPTRLRVQALKSNRDLRVVWLAGTVADPGQLDLRKLSEYTYEPLGDRRCIVTGRFDARAGLDKFALCIEGERP